MNNSEHSAFDHIEATQWDPIIEILEEYRACPDPNKINLTVGAYRDEDLNPNVFRSVHKAEERIFSKKFSRDYLPPTGDEEFNKLTQYTLFPKDHPIHTEGKLVTVQSIAGSGTLRLGGEFISRYISKTIYIPHLTWPNHTPIFKGSMLDVKTYRYYNEKTNFLDEQGFLEDLNNAEENSVVVLHVCGHNPTGIDPDREQWRKIAEIMKARNLFPFFDIAYQGFITGDTLEDSYPIHLFYQLGFEFFISQSFSKTMGLYGERTAPLHVITNDPTSTQNIKNLLGELNVNLFLVPIGHGSRIIKTVLGDETLHQDWLVELKEKVDRLNSVRDKLYQALSDTGVGNWEHIKIQHGMFSYTGLNRGHCERLIKKHKIFLVKSGRISLSGLNDANINKVALAIKEVLTATD